MADTDFRFDPFRQVFRPVAISNEVHVAQYFDAIGRVGFFTREAVQRRSPSTVVIKDAALTTLTEVSRTTNPEYANYRVDYSALTFWSGCFIELHETRIGSVFTVSYYGLGGGLNSSNRADDRFNIERSVTVAGDMTAGSLRVLGAAAFIGAMSLGIGTSSNVSMGGSRVQNIANALASDDLTALGQFLSLFSNRANRVEILSGSGNWTKQRGVRYVFFVIVGGGGGGSNGGNSSGTPQGGGGGGGSPIVYGIADLDAIGGTTFAYSVGSSGGGGNTTAGGNGLNTTMFGCSSGRGLGGTRNVISGISTGGASGGGSVGPNVIGKVVVGSAGGGNSGAASGAGGNAAPMLAQGNPLFSGIGGVTVTGNIIGNDGSSYGAGGSGGGGHPSTDSNGGSGANGTVLLIY